MEPAQASGLLPEVWLGGPGRSRACWDWQLPACWQMAASVASRISFMDLHLNPFLPSKLRGWFLRTLTHRSAGSLSELWTRPWLTSCHCPRHPKRQNSPCTRGALAECRAGLFGPSQSSAPGKMDDRVPCKYLSLVLILIFVNIDTQNISAPG